MPLTFSLGNFGRVWGVRKGRVFGCPEPYFWRDDGGAEAPGRGTGGGGKQPACSMRSLLQGSLCRRTEQVNVSVFCVACHVFPNVHLRGWGLCMGVRAVHGSELSRI